MFCKNCGTEIKGGVKFCPRCGTPAAPPEEATYGQEQQAQGESVQGQSQQTQSWQADAGASAQTGGPQQGPDGGWTDPAADPAQFQGGYHAYQPEMNQPPKKKKGNAKKVIIPVVAVAVVAAVGIGAFAFTRSEFFRSKTKSPEEYYRSVEEAYIDKQLKLISDSADIAGYNEVSVSLQADDAGLALLGMAGALSDEELDALSELEVRVTADQTDEAAGAMVSLCSEGESLLSINMVEDRENGDIYMQLPELSDSYIAFDSGDFSSDFSGDMQSVLSMNSMFDTSKIADILPKYLDVMLDYAVDVEREDSEISVGGVSQDATLLTVVTKGDDLKDMLIELMETAQKDTDLEDILVSYWDYAMGSYDSYYSDYTGRDYYEELMDELSATIESAREEEFPQDAAIKMEVWVDGDGEIIGRTVTISEEGEDMEILRLMSAEKSGEFAQEIAFGDITGDDYYSVEIAGTIDKKTMDGDFSFMYCDEEILQGKIKDYDTELAEKGLLNGSFLFEIDDPDMTGYELQVDCAAEEDSMELSISLVNNDVSVAAVNVEMAAGDSYEPALPGRETVYDAQDDWDMEDYENEIDMEDLEDRLASNEFLAWVIDSFMYDY